MSTVAQSDRGPAFVEPPVRGERLIRFLERPFLWLERVVGQALPEPLNPLLQTGAVAVLTFLIASVSGVLVLVWYSPSVHHAWESVRAMEAQRWGAGLVRSLHRYSSDACMLFVLLHALRLFLARRFGGPRRFAWLTGVLLLIALWGVGWSGYWLVWDERAQLIATGTAKMMDVLPVFADPLSRSFLTDGSLNSLFFFVVFFVHMLLPLGMGIPLWLHVTRLSRARFLTRLPLALWVLGALVVWSWVWPAQVAGPARMTLSPQALTLDAWYLLPLALTDRLGAGALWALFLGGSLALGALPYVLQTKRAAPAKVEVSACNACGLCSEDCPFDAIRMVPRTDGRRFELQAEIDPLRCVGCGICAGSCDPGAIGLESLPVIALRRQVEGLVDEQRAAGEPPVLVFACSSGVGGSLQVDEQGRCAQLPGTRVVQVPCVGAIHPLTLERAFKRGAAFLYVAACGPGECTYREGVRWLEARLDGARQPALRPLHLPRTKVALLRADTRSVFSLQRTVSQRTQPAPQGRLRRLAVRAAVPLSLVSGVGLASQVYYRPPAPRTELVVSFKHPGQRSERCQTLSEEEKQSLPVHMRPPQVCERRRADVRLRVRVDGEEVWKGAYAPSGLSRDGNSVAVERLPLAPGLRHIEVAIGDGAQPEQYAYVSQRQVTLSPGARQVVLFDRLSGFTWEGP